MPVFIYQAKDNLGQRKTGTVDARSEAAAVTLLKEQQLYVISLEEKRETAVGKVFSFQGIPDAEIVTFTRQLSTMMSSGLPISRALEVLAEQTPNKKMRVLLLDSLRNVQGGTSLSSALSQYPKSFSPTYVALVRAGEASGKLDDILKRLADTLEAQRELKSSIKGAMIYPSIVFVAMIGVLILMMVLVIPKLSAMYESMNVELPAITQFMMSASKIMSKRWYVFLILAAGAFFGIKYYFSTPGGRKVFSKVAFKLPVFGKISKQRELTEFTRTLSLLVASGIPIVESLNIVSQVVSNERYKMGAENAAKHVERGGSLSDYLRQDKVFPPILGQMASVGEETGQLDDVLGKVATFFAGEMAFAVKGLSSALEPIILIMLGGMVGVLIVSIITPIYKITSSI